MLLRSAAFGALIILLSFLFLGSCVKTSDLLKPLLPIDTTGINTDTTTPAITPVGSPNGAPVSKTIGPGGGTLTSSDGRIDISIPAGALSANTNITIQPFTNTCPGSSGLAYQLLPEGTKFSTPASLIFHYTADDAGSTDPYFFFSVFQDSVQQWEVNDGDKEVDTVAKTVSFDIAHFSVWALEPGIQITTSKEVLEENDVARVAIWRWVKGKGSTTGVIPNNAFNFSNVTDWSVNSKVGGSAQDGTISPTTGTIVSYTAPSKIDQDREVPITVVVNEAISVKVRKKGTRTVQTITYDATHPYIRFLSLKSTALTFDVNIYLNGNGMEDFAPRGFSNTLYHCVTSFVVHVAHGQVDVPTDSIINQSPQVIPDHDGDLHNGPGYKWLPDQNGMINIQSATGMLLGSPGTDTMVVLTFVQGPTQYPQYLVYDPNSNSSPYTYPDDPTSKPWPNKYFEFVFRDSAQAAPNPALPLPYGFGWEVKPRH